MKGFDDAAGFVLSFEGGFSNYPADRGGPTKFGITQETLDAVRSVIPSLPDGVVALTATQATQIYQLSYWNPYSCGSFPWPISLYLFDAIFNHGPRNGVKMLQRALWVDDDGIVGPETLAAPLEPSVEAIGYAMLTLRREFYSRIVQADGSQQVFLKGWLGRVDRLKQELEPS